jgi:hypothetical protein
MPLDANVRFLKSSKKLEITREWFVDVPIRSHPIPLV